MEKWLAKIGGLAFGVVSIFYSLLIALFIRTTILGSHPTGRGLDTCFLVVLADTMLVVSFFSRGILKVRAWQLLIALALCEAVYLVILVLVLSDFRLPEVMKNTYNNRHDIFYWFSIQQWYPVAGWVGGCLLGELWVRFPPSRRSGNDDSC